MPDIIIAVLYISTGGLVLTMNTVSAFLLVKQLPRYFMALNIYEVSDTIMAILSGLGLICDGCLSLSSQNYYSSCTRYLIIQTLMIIPLAISHFTIYGIFTKHLQDSNEKFYSLRSFQKTISMIWTGVAWLIALVFTLVLWSGTQGFHGRPDHSNTSYAVKAEPRNSKNLVNKLWQYNSNEDWSSDYRESVIIGLIYGIVRGNISHEELQRFRGVSVEDGITNQSKTTIKEFHTALGISEKEQEYIFNINSSNFDHNPTGYNVAQNAEKLFSIRETSKIKDPLTNIYGQEYTGSPASNPLDSLVRNNKLNSASSVSNSSVLQQSSYPALLQNTTLNSENSTNLDKKATKNMIDNTGKKKLVLDTAIIICDTQVIIFFKILNYISTYIQTILFIVTMLVHYHENVIIKANIKH